jgi:hypothetical protein
MRPARALFAIAFAMALATATASAQIEIKFGHVGGPVCE